MVLVVSQHNLPKPYTDFGRAMMLPALKLSLNGFQLRDHPLLRRDPPDDESSVGELPTEVGEAQECEGLWMRRPFPVRRHHQVSQPMRNSLTTVCSSYIKRESPTGSRWVCDRRRYTESRTHPSASRL